MKALTIQQPWAELIVSGQKIVENRTWQTPYRGRIAIHAGRGTAYLTRAELRRYTAGAVVGYADLVGCFSLQWLQCHRRDIARLTGCTYSACQVLDHRYTEGPWCWLLERVTRCTPVFCPGQLGLWNFFETDWIVR